MPTSTTIRSAARVRREFVEFFRARHGHAVVPSSPVVPHEDPTLLFANAGMNQFKDVFLGRREGVEVGGATVRRVVNSQKCIRAGGKHNDLEDVGRDTYHHTFFEMLGNWSFGDYFKAEAIEWAWELLTGRDHWGLDPERLHVTVFAGDAGDGLPADEEAERFWRRFVPAERIGRFGRKDNFWEMGDTGPCGPCSEIHYDFTPDKSGAELVNAGTPDVVEIWNLVFIQFNRGADGSLKPLPARHVDTGMGLERIVRAVQGRASNYDTDLWQPIFRAIAKRTGAHPYQGELDDPVDVAYRVVADHVRCLTVALADGARPSNEGRGYVLRRILRRAVRHARQTLHARGPLLCDLVPAVVESLGEAFPEIVAPAPRVAAAIREEEESFLRTLDRGLELFETVAAAGPIGAEAAFKLHDTYGFPIDLTRVMAAERGLSVDEAGYERLMEQARDRSRATAKGEEAFDLPPDAIARLRHLGVRATRDEDKFHGRPVSSTVRALWNGRDFDEVAQTGDRVAIILDHTNYYAEAGGQVGDAGWIAEEVHGDARATVEDTQARGGYVLHVAHVVDGALRVGEKVTVTVDRDRRRAVMANHTGTHLLNHALREVLGDEVDQRGSLVAPDRLRFDFTSSRPLSPVELDQVEARLRAAVEAALPVHADIVPLAQARRIHGLRAVFGEKYPDPVRVVSIGPAVAELLAGPENTSWRGSSVELCGGTHVASTDEIESVVIVSEQALAAGVRRITAVSGTAARAAEMAARGIEEGLRSAEHLAAEALPDAVDELAAGLERLGLGVAARHRLAPRLEGLRERARAARKEAAGAARSDVVAFARMIADRESGLVITAQIVGADKDTILAALDVIRQRHPASGIMLFAPLEDGERVSIAAAVPPALVARGLKAGDWVREAATICGGGGGGRPDLAQAGGRDASKIGEAMAAARQRAEEVAT